MIKIRENSNEKHTVLMNWHKVSESQNIEWGGFYSFYEAIDNSGTYRTIGVDWHFLDILNKHAPFGKNGVTTEISTKKARTRTRKWFF